jgi:hypothetical protein
MLELRFNTFDFEMRARELEGAIDQVPYALALTLNRAAQNTRRVLIESTWPTHVQQRNSSFIGRALRTKWATKANLVVEIYDDLGRANLVLHAKGGVRVPHGGRSRLAIPPDGSVTRTGRGVRASQRPKAIIAKTPKRALRITSKGIFVGEGGRLHLKYAFKQSAEVPRDVPFYDDFRSTMAIELRTSFAAAMARAMKGRRA